MKSVRQVLLSTTVALMATVANAASMSFVYTGDNNVDSDGAILAVANDLITFDIVMDFTDNPTLGGGYDVYYTPDTLQFESWELVVLGDPDFNRAPDVFEQLGRLESATFGAFEGVSGPATVAQVSFTFLGGPEATLDLAATQFLGAPFISADFLTPIDVEFGSALIRTPLPGAVWFFVSAMGALGALRRRA